MCNRVTAQIITHEDCDRCDHWAWDAPHELRYRRAEECPRCGETWRKVVFDDRLMRVLECLACGCWWTTSTFL